MGMNIVSSSKEEADLGGREQGEISPGLQVFVSEEGSLIFGYMSRGLQLA